MTIRNEHSVQADPLDRRPLNDPLDELLAAHFDAELRPEIGRSVAHFQVSLRQSRRTRTLRLVVGSATVLAASLTLALILQTQFHREAQAPSPRPEPMAIDMNMAPVELERTIAWRTVSDGTILVDDAPMRQVRREVLERVQYYDPARDALVEMVIPREETFLVSLHIY